VLFFVEKCVVCLFLFVERVNIVIRMIFFQLPNLKIVIKCFGCLYELTGGYFVNQLVIMKMIKFYLYKFSKV